MERSIAGPVAGVDEAGRGPLAGPVLAAAVILPLGLCPTVAILLDDSKKLTAAARQIAYAAMRAEPGVIIGVGAASVAEIARLNILHASLLAMRRAVARLGVAPAMALVDGNQDPGLPCPTRCVIGGDALSLSIAAASIVAKVLRDRAMDRLDSRYPGYGWRGNAGYGTAAHRDALQRLGITCHHRVAFGTVREMELQTALELAAAAD
jgi:ribonuclease HII